MRQPMHGKAARRPSMGLAPAIVEEVFNIVKDLNTGRSPS